MLRVQRHTHVLVCDSDPDVALRIRDAIVADGGAAIIARDGADALARLDAQAVDAVYLDLGLTGVSGLEVLAELRDPRRARAPVIVSAPTSGLDLIARALSLGADDFVTRPVDAAAVALRLRARSAPGLRSANLTPVSLRAVGTDSVPRSRTFCPACVTLTTPDSPSCGFCAAPRPLEGWPPVSESGLPHLGALLGGRYLLNRLLGHGGSGDVYRALDVFLKRYYAVKVLDVGGAPDAARVREAAEREVTALARLENPHLVRVFEVHDLPDDRLLVVMDFVDGCTLDTLIARSGPLRPAAALGITRQLAQGLQEVHDAGMVHRDIKPANVMIQELPAGGRFVRILDFGLVRLRGTLERDVIFGTPQFAAPEQLVAGRDVDHRADIYACGLVLLTMLTGVAPEGDGVAALARDRLAGVIPLVDAAADKLPGARDVVPLIRDMTAADPQARVQDLREVVARIDRIAAGRMDTAAWSTV
ncbi:MAG: protein kinase [Myxococcales bacterium]|nr:protein kinase [Myxococcales bacterium]